MQQSLIRYRTKPDQATANEELVRAVYAELHRTRPDGFRYATLKLDDQVTFVHIVQSEHDPSPILAVKAFGEFQAAYGPLRPAPSPAGLHRGGFLPLLYASRARPDRRGDDLLPGRRLQAKGRLGGRGIHNEVGAELVLGLARLPA